MVWYTFFFELSIIKTGTQLVLRPIAIKIIDVVRPTLHATYTVVL